MVVPTLPCLMEAVVQNVHVRLVMMENKCLARSEKQTEPVIQGRYMSVVGIVRLEKE